MMVRAGKTIREQIMKNLLFAHGQIAEHGETKALIVLSKFILKFSKQFDNEFFDLRFKEDENCCEAPPDCSQQNIAGFK